MGQTLAQDFLNFEQQVNSWFVTTEAQVAKIVGQIISDAEVAIQQVDQALQWVVQQVPTITADLQTVLGLVQAVGLASNPEVGAAIAAANVAVSALNAFAAASNSGQTMPSAVVQGYLAVQSATQAVAAAKVAVVSSPAAANPVAAAPATPAPAAALEAAAAAPSA